MIPQDCFMGCIAGGLVPNWIFLLCCMVLCKRHGFWFDIYPSGDLGFCGLILAFVINYLGIILYVCVEGSGLVKTLLIDHLIRLV